MRHILVTEMGNDPDDIEIGLIHYDGVAQIGSATLCGHTDRTQWRFAETTKRVNCRGCLATRNHVMGR